MTAETARLLAGIYPTDCQHPQYRLIMEMIGAAVGKERFVVWEAALMADVWDALIEDGYFITQINNKKFKISW